MVTLPPLPAALEVSIAQAGAVGRSIRPLVALFELARRVTAPPVVLMTVPVVLVLRSMLPPFDAVSVTRTLLGVTPAGEPVKIPGLPAGTAASPLRLIVAPAIIVTGFPVPVVVTDPVLLLVMSPDARIATAWPKVLAPLIWIPPALLAKVGSPVTQLLPSTRVSVDARKCSTAAPVL